MLVGLGGCLPAPQIWVLLGGHLSLPGGAGKGGGFIEVEGGWPEGEGGSGPKPPPNQSAFNPPKSSKYPLRAP